MANTYTEGDLVRVTVSFTTTSGGAAIDPTVVGLNYELESGTATRWIYGGAGSIVKDSVGNYHADLDTTAQPGTWLVRWYSTGSGQAAAPDWYFTVTPSGAR